MLTNLIIPVQDTESAQFKYEGTLTRDAYEDMVLDRFRRTDKQIDAFLHRDKSRDFSYDLHENNNYDEYYDGDDDNEVEVQALLLDSGRNNFDEEFLFDKADEEDMFVLIININPEGLDEDAESEIKYWLDDSYRVLGDEELDSETKLKALPPRDLKIVLSDGNKYTLNNCKIFEDYSDDRYPLYFATIVEKITL
jgi:hypothetical protein